MDAQDRMVPESGPRVYAAWDDWLLTPGGADLVAWLQPRLDAMLEDEFGYFAMQCGMPGLKGLRSNRMSHRIHLTIGPLAQPGEGSGFAATVTKHEESAAAARTPKDLKEEALGDFKAASERPESPTEDRIRQGRLGEDREQSQDRVPSQDRGQSQDRGPLQDREQFPAIEWVVADAYDSLPVASSSIDLLVLPFVLEFSASPHAVLREAHRVLRNEGRVVIAGLNPWSLWGLQELALDVLFGSNLPVEPRMIALGRLRDWLRLLEFDIDRGRFGCYKPLCATQAWLDRWEWIEDAGDRWWPICGAAYLIGAVKRVQGMRLVGLAARPGRKGFAQAQVAGARSV